MPDYPFVSSKIDQYIDSKTRKDPHLGAKTKERLDAIGFPWDIREKRRKQNSEEVAGKCMASYDEFVERQKLDGGETHLRYYGNLAEGSDEKVMSRRLLLLRWKYRNLSWGMETLSDDDKKKWLNEMGDKERKALEERRANNPMTDSEKWLIGELDKRDTWEWDPMTHYKAEDRIESKFRLELEKHGKLPDNETSVWKPAAIDQVFSSGDGRRPDTVYTFSRKVTIMPDEDIVAVEVIDKEGGSDSGSEPLSESEDEEIPVAQVVKRKLKVLIIHAIDEYGHINYNEHDQQLGETYYVTHSINLYHYDCVYMIRTNVAGRYETREDQMNFHFELFDKIYAKPKPGRHFIAIDFPQNHHHVKASLRRKIDNSMGEAAIANKKEDVHLPLYNTAVEEHTPDLPEWEK